MIGKAKILSRGRVTIPKSVRNFLELSSGDKVEFAEVSGKLTLRKVAAPQTALGAEDGPGRSRDQSPDD